MPYFWGMVILSKSKVNEAALLHPQAADALNTWYQTTKLADWGNFNELRADKPDTDYIGNDRYIFNIKSYRLLAMIFFDIRTVFIHAILTHTEYNRLRNRLPTM
jgi:mRNA interferase HigB